MPVSSECILQTVEIVSYPGLTKSFVNLSTKTTLPRISLKIIHLLLNLLFPKHDFFTICLLSSMKNKWYFFLGI